MKHAGTAALDALTNLLLAVRKRGLKELRPGIFYRGDKAWLHFHEDQAGLFADLKTAGEWERFRVSEPAEQTAFLTQIDLSLTQRAK